MHGQRTRAGRKLIIRPNIGRNAQNWEETTKTDEALLLIWERLFLCKAVQEMNQSAAVAFSHALEMTPPRHDKNIKKLWQDAVNTFPDKNDETTSTYNPAPAPKKRRQ